MLNTIEDEELFDYETFCQTFLNLTNLLDSENSTFSSKDLNYNFSRSVDRNEIIKEEEYIKRARIINTKLFPNQRIKIKAVAGSGKTSILKNFARANPNNKYIFICYNKSVQAEKEEEFLKEGITNVSVRTLHSLAWEGTKHFHKKKVVGKFKILERNLSYSFLIEKTLENFFVGNQTEIDSSHIPEEEIKIYFLKERRKYDQSQIKSVKESVLYYSKLIWNNLCDSDSDNIISSKIKINHDAYLKYFQLHTELHASVYRDLPLLIDEGHDFNPCSLDILFRNFKTGIIVYDPHQSIYQFRGALETKEIDSLDTTYEETLAQTFRFGMPLSNLVTKFIKKAKKLPNFEVFSDEKIKTGYTKVSNSFSLIENQTYFLLLSRTNLSLIKELFDIYIKNEEIYYTIYGGDEEFRKTLDELDHLHSFIIGEVNYFEGFSNLTKMINFYLDSKNLAMINKINYVSYNLSSFGLILKKIHNGLCKEKKYSDFTISTTHRVKGSEEDIVYLSDDFIETNSHGIVTSSDFQIISDEEINILNVALTRARKHVYINEKTAERMNSILQENLL